MESGVLCAAVCGMMGLQPTARVALQPLAVPALPAGLAGGFSELTHEKELITENRTPSVWKPLESVVG